MLCSSPTVLSCADAENCQNPHDGSASDYCWCVGWGHSMFLLFSLGKTTNPPSQSQIYGLQSTRLSTSWGQLTINEQKGKTFQRQRKDMLTSSDPFDIFDHLWISWVLGSCTVTKGSKLCNVAAAMDSWQRLLRLVGTCSCRRWWWWCSALTLGNLVWKL